VDKIADFSPNAVGRFKALIADLAKATQIQADKARGLLRMLLGTAIVLHPMADGLDRYLTAEVSPGTMRGYCGCSRVKINLVEGKRSNRRWGPSSALKFKGLLWWRETARALHTAPIRIILKESLPTNAISSSSTPTAAQAADWPTILSAPLGVPLSPFQHRIPRRILPIPPAPVIFDQCVIDIGAV
jgi:hypothetical protein